MTLERYNQILFAVFGTAAIVGGVALLAWIGLVAVQGSPPARILVDQPAAPGPRQELVFCRPTIVPESGLQLLPVAVRAVDDASEDVRVASPMRISSYSSETGNCGLSSYGAGGQVFNVVVRAPGDDRQRLLLDRPAQVEALHLPDEHCARGEGPVPCGLLQWHIRDTDSNGDGAISVDDALIVYHSTSAVAELRPVTPRDASLVSFVWDPKRGSMLFQVRFDRNDDGLFDERDPTEILELDLRSGTVAKEVVAEDLRKELEAQVR